MWALDYTESRVPENWCFWTVVLEKTLESPLDCKEIQPAHPKENQSWIFTWRTDAEAETQSFGHLMRRADLLEKTLMLGKTEGGGDDRGWDGWMASLTKWAWVWASSGNWWWTGKLVVLHSMGWQRVEHAWATELIVDLQCCIGFRCTVKWFNYTYIHIHPFSDFSPIWVITESENICFHLSPLLAYQLCSLVFLFSCVPEVCNIHLQGILP